MGQEQEGREMIEILRSRRSTRKFAPAGLEREKVEELKEALLRSPSSRDLKPWQFVFVSDQETLRGLSSAKESGGAFLAGAPLGIVVLGDESASDVWIEDCSIAAIICQLAAHSLGLGSCWIQIRNRRNADGSTAEERVRRILRIEKPLRVECVIAVGYPGERKDPVKREDLAWGRISGL